MKKKQICVIFGGTGGEYEVSLRSAASVISAIDREKFDVVSLGIDKKNNAFIYTGEPVFIKDGKWTDMKEQLLDAEIVRGGILCGKRTIPIDLYLPIIHGEMGEDGKIQGQLSMCGGEYVGCDISASVLSYDKSLAKAVARSVGATVAQDMKIHRRDIDTFDTRELKFAYPVFVKPTRGGSSVGVSRVENERELIPALRLATVDCEYALIEKEIKGDEVEMAVLERDGEFIFSPIGRVSYGDKFYSYNAKYENENYKIEIPAPVAEIAKERIYSYAKRICRALGVRHLCRLDFFVQGEMVVFNEINTMPGFTEISMFPMLLAETVGNMSALLSYLIESAL